MVVKKKTSVELLNSSENTSLYSISFELDGTTEFEKFVAEFEKNATFNHDYQRIIAALQAILRIGALERFFRPEGKMNDNIQALPQERKTASVLFKNLESNCRFREWRHQNNQNL